jgi:MoaA/NifB/PqqE/SkfB family radical SAM enzyme
MIKLACVLTTECNLRCLHCLRSNVAGSHLPLDKIQKALTGAKKFGLEYVHLTGGEPFLYRHLPGLFELLAANNIQATFSSNGLLFEKNSELINKYRKVIKFINISLDGHVSGVHEAMRGKGTFGAVLDSLEFSRGCKLSFGVNCCLNRYNVDHAADMVKFARKLGAKHINFSTVLPCTNAEENGLVLSETDRKKAYNELRRLAYVSSLDFFKLFYVPVFISEPVYASSNIVMCANQSLRTITIDVDGSLHFCCFLTVYDVAREVEKKLRIANLSDMSFEDGVKLFTDTIYRFLSDRIDDYQLGSFDKEGSDFNSCFYCNKKLGIAG